MTKRILIFDLDMTLIDSSHRTPNFPDGTLDLEGYFLRKNRENIFKDSLLPLVRYARKAFYQNWIVLCTARDCDQDDFDFLNHHGIRYHYLMSRDKLRKEANLTPIQLYHKTVSKKLDANIHYFAPDDIYKRFQLRQFCNLKQWRDLPKYFFDDSKRILSSFRKHPDIQVISAPKINRRLELC